MKKQRDEQDERTVVERHDPLLGQTIGERYRIVQRIAAGGFGAIYRAHDLARRGDVAVKVLHASLAADPNVIARFRREGNTLSNLRAPQTVTTYAFGETDDGMLYIVMELLRGESLHARLQQRGRLPWRDAVAIARAVCDALAEAHELGIIHRDLKPANIHLEPGNVVKVLDFGIAKIRRGTGLDDGGDLTNAGQMIGTIDYMAPEQILGAACDGRTDLFTLGIVTYEMITGRRPFADSTTPTSMLAALLTQIPPPVSSFVPVPAALDEAIARCVRREAAERFDSVLELAAVLDGILAPHPGDDTATRQIELEATRVTDPISFDDEATTFAPEPRRRAPQAVEAVAPPAVREPTPSPRRPAVREPTPPPRPPAAREPTPPPRPPAAREPMPPPRPPAAREPTPPPRSPAAREPTPPPRSPAGPVRTPGPLAAAEASAWQTAGVPRVTRPSEPPPWQRAGASTSMPAQARVPTPAGGPPRPHVVTPAGVSVAPPPPPAPVTHAPLATPPGTSLSPPAASTRVYDASRDAIVGRVVWILALVVILVLGIGIFTAIR